MDKLSLEIESLRQEMHELIENEEYMITPKVIIISQKLDELLTKYNAMKLELL